MLSKIEKEQLAKAEKTSKDYSEQSTKITDSTLADIQKVIDSSTVAPANAQAQQQVNSGYDNLIQSNALQESISRQSVENALSKLGYLQPKLNQTENLALMSQQGNANYNAQIQRDQDNRVLSDLLSAYQAQSNAGQVQSQANLENQFTNAALQERSQGVQNALLNTANNYQAQREADAQAAQNEAEEQRRWAALQPQETESFPIDQLKVLTDNGLSIEDAIRIIANDQSVYSELQEQVIQEKNKETEKVLSGEKKQKGIWDTLTPWDTGHEKNLKEYGQTEQGRVEAMKSTIADYTDVDAGDFVSEITGGYYPKISKNPPQWEPFDNLVDKRLKRITDTFGLKFSDDEINRIKQDLEPELNIAKRVYDSKIEVLKEAEKK